MKNLGKLQIKLYLSSFRKHMFVFLIVIAVIACAYGEVKELKCHQGEPNSGVVNPLACYIDEMVHLGEGDRLTFASDTPHSEILWLNFWVPKHSTLKEPSSLTSIPGEIFEIFANLQSLSITGQLKHLKSADFRNASKLHDLLLANNELEYLDATVFDAADNLEKLDVSFNKITDIVDNSFANANRLKYLYLQRNALTKINRNAFVGLIRLRSLILDHNQIAEIEEGTFNLPNLKELTINKNQLKILSDHLFVNTPNLYKLQINGNHLERVGQSLNDLHNIEYIALENNAIEDLNIASLTALRTLQYLFLSNNGHAFDNDTLFDIADIDARSSSNLKYLIVSDNGLTQENFIQNLGRLNLNDLERLDLDGNQFRRINFDGLKQLFPKLITIDLGVNKWSCEWLSDTFDRFDRENIDVTLFSSRFPFRSGIRQIRFIQCV